MNELANQMDAMMRECTRAPRVLVVEDNANDVALILDVLNNIYCESIIARSGKEALTLITSAEPFDLILLDLILPCMEGLNVLQAAKLKMPTTPVVIVTGLSSGAAALAAREIGYVGVIEKPLTLKDLLRIFNSHRLAFRLKGQE